MTVTVTGPEALTGSTGPSTFTVTYRPLLSNADQYVWDTGCLPGQGGWGLCSAPFAYNCKIPGGGGFGTNIDDCHNSLGQVTGIDGQIGADYVDRVFYKSTKVTVTQGRLNLSPTAAPSFPCLVNVTYKNYWNPGCPNPDPPPPCGWQACHFQADHLICNEVHASSHGKVESLSLKCICLCEIKVIGPYNFTPIPAGAFEPQAPYYYDSYSASTGVFTHGKPFDRLDQATYLTALCERPLDHFSTNKDGHSTCGTPIPAFNAHVTEGTR